MEYKELVQVLKQTRQGLLCIVQLRCGGPWIGQVKLVSSEGNGTCELHHLGVHGSEKTLRLVSDDVFEASPLDPISDEAVKLQRLAEMLEAVQQIRKDLRADLGYKC